MKKQTRIIAITFLAFGLYFVLDELYFGAARKWIDGAIGQLGVSHLVAYFIFGIPLYVGTLLLHRFRQCFRRRLCQYLPGAGHRSGDNRHPGLQAQKGVRAGGQPAAGLDEGWGASTIEVELRLNPKLFTL